MWIFDSTRKSPSGNGGCSSHPDNEASLLNPTTSLNCWHDIQQSGSQFDGWLVTSDNDFLHGFSEAKLTTSPAGHGLFTGTLNTKVGLVFIHPHYYYIDSDLICYYKLFQSFLHFYSVCIDFLCILLLVNVTIVYIYQVPDDGENNYSGYCNMRCLKPTVSWTIIDVFDIFNNSVDPTAVLPDLQINLRFVDFYSFFL